MVMSMCQHQHCTKNGVTNANTKNNMSIMTNEKIKMHDFQKNNTIQETPCNEKGIKVLPKMKPSPTEN